MMVLNLNAHVLTQSARHKPCSAVAAAPFFLMSISNSLSPLDVWVLAVTAVFTRPSVVLVGDCGLETSCDCTSAAG